MNKTLISYTLSIFVIDLNQILVRMLGKPIKQMKAYRYLMSKLISHQCFCKNTGRYRTNASERAQRMCRKFMAIFEKHQKQKIASMFLSSIFSKLKYELV